MRAVFWLSLALALACVLLALSVAPTHELAGMAALLAAAALTTAYHAARFQA